jgi:hypothetical protein
MTWEVPDKRFTPRELAQVAAARIVVRHVVTT